MNVKQLQRLERQVEAGEDGIKAIDMLAQAVPLSRQKLKQTMEKGGIWLKKAKGGRRRLRRAKSVLQKGDVLVSDMTDPDWEPVMKRAAAIVTNRGGRTCHAAIIARELGIPAVVGCGDATAIIKDGSNVTVSCAEGDEGFVYEGALEFEKTLIELDALPEIPVKIMLNVGNPDRAFDFARIPNHGVGLARLEFIINRMIGVHPQALLEYEALDDGT